MPSTPADQVAAVCYRWESGQLQFLLILSSGRRRIFPKGNIDEGETPWQAAQREAFEEAGVLGEIDREQLAVFLHQKRDLKARGVEKQVAAYLLSVQSTVPPREAHRDPQWYTPEGAIAALAADRDFEHAEELRRVVRAAVAAIGDAPAAGRAKTPGRVQQAERDAIRVFVSYSHQDAKYLKPTSLLGYLSGLRSEGFDFWHDERILTSEPWDERIRGEMERADIALVLVSQAFLNSRYCREVEITTFAAAREKAGLKIFPVILSKCDWKSHPWLASTQYQPRGDQTIESHFKEKGKRDGLYLQILQELRELGKEIRARR